MHSTLNCGNLILTNKSCLICWDVISYHKHLLTGSQLTLQVSTILPIASTDTNIPWRLHVRLRLAWEHGLGGAPVSSGSVVVGVVLGLGPAALGFTAVVGGGGPLQ